MVVIFTFGTLMKGGRFASQFDADRKKIAVGKLTHYKMYDNDGAYPIIIFTDNPNDFVLGELHLYNNANQVLKKMDRIEGFDPNNEDTSLFIRKRAKNQIRMGGQKRSVYFYCWNGPTKNKVEVPDGDWRAWKRRDADRRKKRGR